MAVNPMVRIPVREQEAKERAHNFEEVCYGYNIEEMAEEMKIQSKKELEYMTSVNISMVNVKIVKIEVDEEKLQEKALRYEKAVKNMTKLEKNKRK